MTAQDHRVNVEADQESVFEALSISINGSAEELPDDPRVSLLDYLRERLALQGTKKGCDQGACGACTVLVDGERILSCLALAVQYDGRSVTTIEGLGRRRRAAPAAAGVHRARRVPVRLLHAGADLLGGRHGGGGEARRAEPGHGRPVGRDDRAQPRRAARADERQPVPLRRA